MREIPVQPTALQYFSVIIDEVNVQITLRTTQTGLYADVLANGVPIVTGRKCQDRTNLTAGATYRGFPGLQLYFVDLQGISAPVWSELGTRFVLLAGVPDVSTPVMPPLTVSAVARTLTG